MSERSTLHVFAEHLSLAIAPLEDATRDVERFRALMRRLGWSVTSLPASWTALGDRAADALQAVEALADDATPAEIADAISKVGEVYRAAKALTEAPAGVDATALLAEIGEALFEYLLVEYLARALPALYRALEMLDVVVHEPHDAAPGRPAYLRTRLRYGEIPKVLADPLSVPRRVYGWGERELDFPLLAEHLLYVLGALGLNASYESLRPGTADAFQEGAPEDIEKTIDAQVKLSLLETEIAGSGVEVALAMMELPPEGTHPAGIIVRPIVPDGVAERIDLGSGLAFRLRAGTDLAQQFGIVLRPEEIAVRYPFAPGSPPPSAGFGIALEYAPASPTALLGKAGRSRLEIAGGTAALDLDLRDGKLELRLSAAPAGLALVISPADLDGFLGSLAAGAELTVPIELGVAWSNRTGLTFTGGAGFVVSLSPHLELGPITIERVDLEVASRFGEGVPPSVAASAALTFTGAVGPVAVAVEHVGLSLDLLFADGNAGPLDVGVSFVPPTALGLAIDAGPVSGGGFIRFEPEEHRYSGILYLEVFSIGVTAIGLLTTTDADGGDLPPPGFSFLVIVTAEFPPIQLGYGFTLNGAGGIAGLHRTVAIEPLQAGIRTGSLDHVLFPQDPIRNAPQIVNDLELLFPRRANRYVFGPVALIGWGTPTLVTIELGIVVELPSPVRLVLLGQLSVALPTEEVAIVSLHVDVLGVIDFEKKLVSVDAALRDSTVAGFALTGEMAMRLEYGAHPSFALALGGLNPRFQPPPGFPALQRLALSIGFEDNPRISLQAYLALTSNSLQLGARAELYAEAAGFNVVGWVGFDALVVFVPFSFRADLDAGFALRKGTKRIAGIHVEATLEGPSPYHVYGKGCLSLLFFDVCVGFDATFGERRQAQLPAKHPWDELRTALEDRRNWSSGIPGTVVAAVHPAKPAGGAVGLVLVHPSGTAVIRQRVLPLDKKLERFGELELQGPDRYAIGPVSVGGRPTDAWQRVRDSLPPALSEKLSDDEKLSRDSFEEEVVGIEVGVPDAVHGAPKSSTLVYESRIVDSAWESRPQRPYALPLADQLSLADVGAKAFSQLWSTGTRAYAPRRGTPRAAALDDETFVVATTDDITARDDLGRHRTKGAAMRALKEHLAARPGDRGKLQVVSTHELVEAR